MPLTESHTPASGGGPLTEATVGDLETMDERRFVAGDFELAPAAG